MEEGVLSMNPTNWLSYSTSKKILSTYILLLDLLYSRIKASSSMFVSGLGWMRTCSSLKKTETSNSPVSLHTFINFPSRICITYETILFENPHFFEKILLLEIFLWKNAVTWSYSDE